MNPAEPYLTVAEMCRLAPDLFRVGPAPENAPLPVINSFPELSAA